MKHYTTTQLKRIAADLFKPQGKASTPKKPSQTLLKVKAAAKKLLAKKTKTPEEVMRSTMVSELSKSVNTSIGRKVFHSSITSNFKPFRATLGTTRAELKAVTQSDLLQLTDSELKLLKIRIDNAQQQRRYDKSINK